MVVEEGSKKENMNENEKNHQKAYSIRTPYRRKRAVVRAEMRPNKSRASFFFRATRTTRPTFGKKKPSMSKKSSAANTKALADALSGVGAALVALWVFYPIDVWKTHIQAGKKPPPLRRMMSSGLQTKSLHTASSSFFYFYLYSWILSSWTARIPTSSKKMSVSTRLLLSAVAAMLNTCLTLPLDVLSARHQTASPESNKNHYQPESEDMEKSGNEPDSLTRQYLRQLFGESGLWKGLKPSLILCSNPAINYTVFDTVKSRYTAGRTRNSLSSVEAFLLGLFSKFVATMATYPLIRAKVMLMVTSQSSMYQCLQETYKENGVRGLYEGCDLQLLHTLLKSALLMTIRERISEVTQQWVVVERVQANSTNG